jgi:hypothetical protein
MDDPFPSDPHTDPSYEHPHAQISILHSLKYCMLLALWIYRHFEECTVFASVVSVEGSWSIRQKNGFAELDFPNRHNAEIVLSIRQNLPNSSLLTISVAWDGLIKFWD